MSILDGLNPAQREAVETVEGPVLILAGAGSGKTRALTHRIAYLIEVKGVNPASVLALTFTNKAAGEMKERVERLLGRSSRGMWVGTFHAICARILRMEAERIGFDRNFAIYDSDDQLTLVRRAIADLEVSDRQYPPARVRGRISRAKNGMVGPAEFARSAGNVYEQTVARVYQHYQRELRRNNALDFDDLIVEPVHLFQEHPDALALYRERFRYVLIDEYQDTNRPQYLLTKLIADGRRNLCCVGDDDQSIYRFRGADLRNILDFERDYPEAKVVRLEQNYRSTQTILDAGNAVISHNKGRKGKTLWTERAGGEKVVLFRCADEREEARAILDVVRGMRRGRTLRDFALLYRTNAQSRALEDEFRRAGIPYVIVGGLRFYERKEIKDILAYLRVVANPRDGVSLRRVANVPRRGIGEQSLAKVEDFAFGERITPLGAMGRAEEIEGLGAKVKGAMKRFHALILGLAEEKEQAPVHRMAEAVVTQTGYLEAVREEEGAVEAETRIENVRELLSAMEEFSERAEDPSLDAFLREVSLISDVDQWDSRADAVTLMTLHSAKGLEFPAVFIAGLEDGLFPISRMAEDPEDLEEERRLFYVGITRAKERLFLSYAMGRRRYGSSGESYPSRFLGEVPEHLIERKTPGMWEESERRKAKGEREVASPGSKKKSRVQGPGSRVHKSSPGSRVQGPRSKPMTLDSGLGTQDSGAFDFEDALPFNVGNWIIHPTWGRGQIREKDGVGPEAKLTIRFDTGTTKKIIVKYASLEPG
ncbi:MAG: hypothetical protein A3F84_17920 [Candidatus Handelsmanbacteria bacterium RIFCSPLOWO2_12_FULL_64_10]|uniref:DNA 3'-5' helicase n=1 Tax=Handelsmanbacteria sp. (strain RIFCSPLOWO2_12_FULL_64_10) TaxID=1817868 RepID=A0A1F6CQ56_HANXR|nr:MAG: hypothetical protein A3F84_17920 [Candidatus Handelsmanbacteria bacterium RIFCSPLOWO2_12_FULL_64_10]